MRELWREKDLPVEHRTAHADAALQNALALLDSPAWFELRAWISDEIERARDALEHSTKDPVDSDDFHRGFLAACRAIGGRPEAIEQVARKFIKDHGAGA